MNKEFLKLLEIFGKDKENWFHLHYYPFKPGENKWVATQANPVFQETLKLLDEKFETDGKTPQEATKNLYNKLRGIEAIKV